MFSWDGLTALGGIVAIIWAYGSAGEERRVNFRAWAASHIASVAPAAKRAAWLSGFAALAVGAGAVAISSGLWIFGFLTRDAPIARKEVFELILNMVNVTVYSGVALAGVTLIFKFPQRETISGMHVISSREGEYLELKLDGECDVSTLEQQLRGEGIRIRLDKVVRGKARIAIQAPASLVQVVREAEA